MIKKLGIYLPEHMLDIAHKKPQSFYANVKSAFEGIDFKVNFVASTRQNLLSSFTPDSYCLFHRDNPWHENAIEARPAPFGAFWSIDKTADPFEKLIAKSQFQPQNISSELAAEFFDRMADKHRVLPSVSSDEVGFALVALQGVIGTQRTWQSMSPIEMIKTTIKHEKDRTILIKLHPREDHSSNDMERLNALLCDRVRIVQGDLNVLLAGCDYTVSMNSSVSFKGLLYRKPGILFGGAEFHHVFQSIDKTGAGQCFANVMQKPVDFEKYLLWFLRRQMIGNFKNSVQSDILKRCSVLGWELGG